MTTIKKLFKVPTRISLTRGIFCGGFNSGHPPSHYIFFTMSNLTRYIPYTELKGGNNLRFELHYDLGGMSYFSWQKTERGIWLNMRLIEKDNHIERYPMFWQGKDRKRLMMKLNRSNPKKLSAMWDMIHSHTDEEFISYYLHNSGPLAETLLEIEMGHKPELISIPVSTLR